MADQRRLFQQRLSGGEIMTIETKYNIGDEVWWKDKQGGIYNDIVSAIQISVYDQESNVGIRYGIKHKTFDNYHYEWFWDFYPTKEELLKSL